MRLVTQWVRIQRGLPEGWTDARLRLTVATEAKLPRASALLGPLAPGRAGTELRFHADRGGAGPSPGTVQRALARLDAEPIRATLELVSADVREAPPEPVGPKTLAESWDAAVALLPDDWSDIYAQVEIASSDDLGPAALDLAPVNPANFGDGTIFRFRCARRFGYGASPGMVRRCFERLDANGIGGRIEILRSLADTRPVDTQGPVWYVGGKAV